MTSRSRRYRDPQPGDLLTSTEAAHLIGVSARSIARWAELGILASWRTPGGHRRYRRADVEALRHPEPYTNGDVA